MVPVGGLEPPRPKASDFEFCHNIRPLNGFSHKLGKRMMLVLNLAPEKPRKGLFTLLNFFYWPQTA